jgi:hypothetical protein
VKIGDEAATPLTSADIVAGQTPTLANPLTAGDRVVRSGARLRRLGRIKCVLTIPPTRFAITARADSSVTRPEVSYRIAGVTFTQREWLSGLSFGSASRSASSDDPSRRV